MLTLCAQNACKDAVEGSHPEATGTLLPHLPCYASLHLVGSFVGEGQGQDVPRFHALAQEVGDFIGEDTCLSRASAGNDKGWAVAVENSLALGSVEFVEIVVRKHS